MATGFNKWGMTNGTVAAQIVTDAIVGRRNPWASLSAPTGDRPAPRWRS